MADVVVCTRKRGVGGGSAVCRRLLCERTIGGVGVMQCV